MVNRSENGEETKTCPRCGEEVLEHLAQCSKCHYAFLMLCGGCGRDVQGRVFCRECSESGIYHFQRTNVLPPAQPLSPEEKSVEKLVYELLNNPRSEEITGF